MGLVVRPRDRYLMYQGSYEKPMLELSKEEPRISLINKFLKAFQLRLNNIKFNIETASNDYIHFSKFDGPTFFDVSFGLEEVSAKLNNPQNEAQEVDLYGRLFQVLEQISVSHQKMIIDQQFSTKGDVISFLKSLNPNCPDNFKEFLHGRGVYYILKISEHELTIYITLVDSLLFPGGLYLSIENDLSPNKYDSHNAFKIAKEHYDFILGGLNLSIEEES